MREPVHGRRRKELRAKGYDYSTPGYYFVTICVADHKLVFGDIVEGQMILNDAGRIASSGLHSLPARFPEISLDTSIIMPNHIHAIVGIGVDPDVAAQFIAPFARRSQEGPGISNVIDVERGAINCAATRNSPSLGNIIRVYKAATSQQIRRSGHSDFRWQSNYYDRIVRNERELDRIRDYIDANPGNWHLDRDNPASYRAR